MINEFPFDVPTLDNGADLPRVNETYIITLNDDPEPIYTPCPSYKLLLNFALGKTTSDSEIISLSGKTNKSILGEVYQFSKEGKNFIFIRFNRSDGILQKMFVSDDFGLKVRGICHLFGDKIHHLPHWCHAVSNMIIENYLIPNSDAHFISTELNRSKNILTLRIEKNFSKDPLPYQVEFPSDQTTKNSISHCHSGIPLKINFEPPSDIEAGLSESERHQSSVQEEKQMTAVVNAVEQEKNHADFEPVQSSHTSKQQEIIEKLQNFRFENKTREIIRLRSSLEDSYIYAVLWCLLNTPLFVPYFLQKFHETERTKKSRGLISCFFGKIVDKVACCNEHSYRECCSDIEDLVRIMRFCLRDQLEDFEKNVEGDAIQFMNSFLEVVNKELNRVNEESSYMQFESDFPEKEIPIKLQEFTEYTLSRGDSIVNDLFKGQMINTLQCLKCNHKKYTFNDFGELSVKLNPRKKKGLYLLDDLIADALKEETVSDGAGCKNCRGSDIKLKSQICKLPEILIITFNRQDTELSEDGVQFPMYGLDLSQYLEKSVNIIKDSKYSLFGLVGSSESRNMEYYTSGFRDLYTQKWYAFNGNEVRASRITQEKELQISNLAILFYIKSSYLV